MWQPSFSSIQIAASKRGTFARVLLVKISIFGSIRSSKFHVLFASLCSNSYLPSSCTSTSVGCINSTFLSHKFVTFPLVSSLFTSVLTEYHFSVYLYVTSSEYHLCFVPYTSSPAFGIIFRVRMT